MVGAAQQDLEIAVLHLEAIRQAIGELDKRQREKRRADLETRLHCRPIGVHADKFRQKTLLIIVEQFLLQRPIAQRRHELLDIVE